MDGPFYYPPRRFRQVSRAARLCFGRDWKRVNERAHLVPKLHLGTQLRAQLHCGGEVTALCLAFKLSPGNRVAGTRTFPNRVWERDTSKLCFTSLHHGWQQPGFCYHPQQKGDGGFAKLSFAGWVRDQVQLGHEKKSGPGVFVGWHVPLHRVRMSRATRGKLALFVTRTADYPVLFSSSLPSTCYVMGHARFR